jgi:hypothetical protein
MPARKRKPASSSKRRRRTASTGMTALPLTPPPIVDVPPDEVGATVQSFIDNDGVKEIKAVEQPNGLFSVIPQRAA